jgi:hypothetical protein
MPPRRPLVGGLKFTGFKKEAPAAWAHTLGAKSKNMSTIIRLLTLALVAITYINCEPDRPKEYITFPVNQFVISADKDTVLFGPEGTRIFLKKNTFENNAGQTITDSISIQLQEFYDKSAMSLANLSTQSDDKLLETGGMIHLAANYIGEELKIRSDKRIVVHFPKSIDDNREMNLFYAEPSSVDSSVRSWEIDTTDLVKQTLKLGGYGWWYPSPNDSTGYDFTPKNYVDTGYYWNPLDLYVKSYDFTEETVEEIDTTLNKNAFPDFGSWNSYGVEVRLQGAQFIPVPYMR